MTDTRIEWGYFDPQLGRVIQSVEYPGGIETMRPSLAAAIRAAERTGGRVRRRVVTTTEWESVDVDALANPDRS